MRIVSALLLVGSIDASTGASAGIDGSTARWIGTWATAPQFSGTSAVDTYASQTLRLIVHASTGGKKVRIRISNLYGSQPLEIGAAHIARRIKDASIDSASDRRLTFRARTSATIAAGSLMVSDPIDLDVPPVSDLAISLFLPRSTPVTTLHTLAKQTSYLSTATGDATADVTFPTSKIIRTWPFLTGVDVASSATSASIVAFGSSTTDGDGSTTDANRRWPDVLAERLQEAGGRYAELGVLNLGIIGNRLLFDVHSPKQTGGPFGEVFDRLAPQLGDAGVKRFDRDVLGQAGVKFVILVLGINDILFPGSFIPASERVTADHVIAGNRQLIARAHKKGLSVIVTTIPPFENALFRTPPIVFSKPEHEQVRQQVNSWIRSSREFEGMADFDAVVRDPDHPTQLLPRYDAGDHLHVNDTANVAQANAIALAVFGGKPRT